MAASCALKEECHTQRHCEPSVGGTLRSRFHGGHRDCPCFLRSRHSVAGSGPLCVTLFKAPLSCTIHTGLSCWTMRSSDWLAMTSTSSYHLLRLESVLSCQHQDWWPLTHACLPPLPYFSSSCPQVASPVAPVLVLALLLALPASFLLGHLLFPVWVLDMAFLHPQPCMLLSHLSVLIRSAMLG